ncbi:MAG: sugar ABC transporter ATP-binding protein [Lentisphaerae bacterium]|nr:sugar ABC transporter ATP-binding protein [Lentisphaerota bacterium]
MSFLMMHPAQTTSVLRMDGIGMRFGPVTVLDDVSFDLRAGEVHVLAGENGAGKSTLIKILAGVHRPCGGTMTLDGCAYAPAGPNDATHRGVAVVHQELSLIPAMSVADNLFLGCERTRGGWVDHASQHAAARRALAGIGLELDVTRAVESFPIGVRQMIEIGKALAHEARVLVMDEPTSALNAQEAEQLFALVALLKGRGCGLVYITHKMEEIERLADRITVLRDGRRVGTAPRAELPMERLVEWMVGREVGERFPRHAPHAGEELLRLTGFSVFSGGRSARPTVDGVSLTVRRGEIVGLGGLQGSGGSELMGGLFGAYGARTSGTAAVRGRAARFTAPRQAIRAGLAYVTNDRKASGLVLDQTIVFNATLADLPRLSPFGWRRPRAERAAAREATQPLQLRADSLDMSVGALSGGNQQKVVVAKWLRLGPDLLLLDEPTRGIDVGAKRELYSLLNAWTARGMGILMITSEMPELLAMSDRIVVLHRGRATATLTAAEATAERVLAAAMGQGGASRVTEATQS